jgi:HKD family nuclease
MLQHKLKLSSDISSTLKNCEEIWVAVAMVSDSGYKFIQDNINKVAKQNYLIGIGLPTSPKVLRELYTVNKNGIFDSKIYHKEGVLFHPKVYIIKTNNKYIAYIGSGNCTDGGFDKNIEVSIKTDDQKVCSDLINWFTIQFKLSKTISEDFLVSYQNIFDSRIERMKNDRKEIKSLFPNIVETLNLDDIDFKNQFFKKEDFLSFEKSKQSNHSQSADEERKKVKNKLFKLHDNIIQKIKSEDWNLSEHYESENIVSSAVHTSFTAKEIDGIWLHYGRSKKEIKAYGEGETPLNYMRLQVIVTENSVGIWNCVGKSNGGRIDRDNLREKLRNDVHKQNLFRMINELPDDYYFNVNNTIKPVRAFETEEQLINYILEDNCNHYFILGIDYKPDNINISEKHIVNTIMDNFKLLYPTYEFIKHNLGY